MGRVIMGISGCGKLQVLLGSLEVYVGVGHSWDITGEYVLVNGICCTTWVSDNEITCVEG